MPTTIDFNNFSTSLQQQVIVPKISLIDYPGDDTAADPAGGQTITLTGEGFITGFSIIINGQAVGSVTFVSSTSVTFISPALSAGSYPLYLINPGGSTAILVPGIQYSGVPTWTTPAGNLGSVYEVSSINTTVVATADSAITYSLASGTLPTGSTLASNGLISGTSSVTSNPTTFTFTIKATDAELQDTNRTFTLTVNPDTVSWVSPANGTTYTVTADTPIANVTMSATSAAGFGITYSADTLPTGLSISGANIAGTPSVAGNTTSILTATANTSNRSATRTIYWVVDVGNDAYWNYVTTLLSASTPTTLPFNRDASTNNFDLTIAGDTRPYNFNPYTPGYYSNYFDGSGDSLTLPSSASMSLDGQFTIECWVYWSGTATYYQNFVGSNNTFTSNASFFRVWGTGFGTATIYNKIGIGNPTHDGTSSVYSTNNLTPNTWNHVAATRDSNNIIRVFINGNLEKTGSTDTSVYDFGQGGTCIGDSPWDGANGWYSGYISNLRVIKGSCLYTASFTPSTGPLTAIANTSLLTCQSNRFIDNSTNNFAITKNGDTSVKSFNPYTPSSSYSTYGSTYFDGSGDFLSTPTGPAAFDFTSTKTLTLEFWVNSPAWPSPCCFFDLQECQPFRVLYSPGTISWQATSGGGNILTASVTLAVNTWYHIAFVRNTDTLYIFVDGVQVATGSYGNNWPSTAAGNVRIGCNRGDTWFVNGYMADVRLVKGTALYTSNFTPPTSPLTAISGTSLLTCQSNQPANNNVFLDQSTNNFTITRSGNTTQGTFSPYGANWSNYFDGNGDFLSLSNNSAFLFGSGDFTIELWYYATVLGVQQTFMAIWDDASTTPQAWTLYANASNKIVFLVDVATTDTTIFTSSYTIVSNTWTHIAVSRSGNTWRLFVNGTLDSTTTNSSTISSGNAPLGIGGYSGASAASKLSFNGYISNARIVKGTAVYTGAFTPPTAPLTPIDNTSLLTCANNRFVDQSANNFAITRNGDVSVQKFGPFAGTTLPTPYYGAYFDGSGDYLNLTKTGGLGAGNLTIEFWYYPTANTGMIFNSRTAGTGDDGIDISTTLSTTTFGTVLFSAQSITLNAWTHVAIVRNGTTMVRYVNGIAAGTVTFNGNFSGANFHIGGNAAGGNTGYLTGYISNFRVTNTAVYTSNFTPSTTPLTAISGTSLLTCQSSTFIDNSTNNFTITANGNSKPTTFNPFTVTYSTNQSYTPSVYGGSMYFDGTGDYLSIPNNTALQLTTGTAFTIEAWIYINTLVSGDQGIISKRQSGNEWQLNIHPSFGYLNFWNASSTYQSNITLTTRQWYHVAVTWDTTTLRFFVNGVMGSTYTGFTVSSSTNQVNIGCLLSDGSNPFNGYISDLRLIKGQALYTSNFVPLNAPLQAVQNSVLLVNGTSGGIYDSSENAVFETVGDAKLSTSTVKFSGSTSVYFDGTGDSLYYASGQSAVFGTGDFTVEFWINRTSAGNGVLFDTRYPNDNANAGFDINIYSNTINWGTALSNYVVGNTATTTGVWYHIAATRSGNSFKLFLDGVQQGSTFTGSASQNFTNVGLYIGNGRNGAFNGYISDLRITKGVARYTTTFTPPTSPVRPY